jgi:hypothetical protein
MSTSVGAAAAEELGAPPVGRVPPCEEAGRCGGAGPGWEPASCIAPWSAGQRPNAGVMASCCGCMGRPTCAMRLEAPTHPVKCAVGRPTRPSPPDVDLLFVEYVANDGSNA